MAAPLGNIPLTDLVPYDNEVVKLTGDQTIAGSKTFNSSPIVPTLESTDDNSTKSASTGWVTSKLTAWWNAIKGAAVSFSNSVTASGGFIGNLTGDVTGHASQDALDNAVVKLTGSQTITGDKTINGQWTMLSFRNPVMVKDVVPSSWQSTGIGMKDSNGSTVSELLYFIDNVGSTGMRFQVNPTTNSSDNFNLTLYRSSSNVNQILARNIGEVKGSAFAAVGMPSSSYVDIILTEGAAYYTPPCNGFIMLTGISTNSNQCIRADQNGRLSCQKWAVSSNQGLELFLPVVSNIQCSISMSVGTINICRFIKANAEVA